MSIAAFGLVEKTSFGASARSQAARPGLRGKRWFMCLEFSAMLALLVGCDGGSGTGSHGHSPGEPSVDAGPGGPVGEPTQSLVLPIEVIGEEGKTVQRTLVLDESQAEAGTRLGLQINNLGYQNKASVRINGGAWVDLNHDTAELQEQEAARGGMVHGGFNTVRLSIALSAKLKSGDNTLSFRFNSSDGVSIGYRVIAMTVLNAAGEALVPGSDFPLDDPATWKPPYEDRASIEEGEALWRNAPLVSNYLTTRGNWYASPIGTSAPIRARCADCHAQDGRDLEIFAYSNGSIIERSKFHGLSAEQGKKIASYIRSLSALPKVGRYGRPWNPPFQPGPAVAERPVHEWAAGAGLEAVLEQDEEMLFGMFGKASGITRKEVESYFDSDKMWNTATQRLAVQLPDWKHWLPLIHPKDAFRRNEYYASAKQYDIRKGLRELRAYLVDQRGNYTRPKLFAALHAFWLQFRKFLVQGSSDHEHWRTRDGHAFTRGLVEGVSKEMAATSLARLLAVKFFEVHHEFELQGLAQDLIPAAEQPRARQWLGEQYNVFEIPSHFTGCFKDGAERCHNYVGQPREAGEYESTAWYQLQQVINPGIATSKDVVPVDYHYQPTLILRASATSKRVEPVRFYFSSNVMYQTHSRVEPKSPMEQGGFYMRVMGPWLFYGADNRNSSQGLGEGTMPRKLNELQPGLGVLVVTAQIKQFLREMKRPRNNLDDWERRASSGSGSHRALDPKSLTDADMPRLDQPLSGDLWHYAHKLYWVLPRFIDFGVDCEVIEDLKNWSKQAWPGIGWNRFQCPRN